jgi:hypothetical protein
LDGAALTFDIKPDGSKDDAGEGSFLNEAEGLVLTWGADIYLDPYPTDQFVLRLKLAGGSEATKVFAVRLQLLFVGDRETLSQHVRAIAYFAAAKELTARSLKANVDGGSEKKVEQLQKTAYLYETKALGFLGIQRGAKPPVSSGSSGGVYAGGKIANPAWDRVRNRRS